MFGMINLIRPIWIYWKGLSTVYAVTNQRVMILSGSSTGSAKFLKPTDIFDVQHRGTTGWIGRRDDPHGIQCAGEEYLGAKGGLALRRAQCEGSCTAGFRLEGPPNDGVTIQDQKRGLHSRLLRTGLPLV